MSQDTIDLTWPLGDNHDCELCGFTWNEVGLETWDEEEGIWQLYIRVGCYGGDSVMSTDSNWEKKSIEIVEQATWYSGFSEDNLKELKEKLALIKGENE